MSITDKNAYHKIITDSYNERSEIYNDSEWHRDIAEKLVDYSPPPKGGVVLDIGTGTGVVTFYSSSIVGSNGKVFGVDISEGMISKANELLALSNLKNIEFQLSDGESLDFSVNSFDNIYSASSFFWMANKLKALEYWYSLLKSGGTVAIHAWPETSYLGGYISQKIFKKYGINITMHNETATLEKTKALLEKAGYENVKLLVEEDGKFLSLDDAKKGLFNEKQYAHGQYPHPLTGVSDEVIKKAQVDFEIEMEKRNTDKGVWNDLTFFYVSGQKPTNT